MRPDGIPTPARGNEKIKEIRSLNTSGQAFWKNRISHRAAIKEIRSLNTSGQAFWKNRISHRAAIKEIRFRANVLKRLGKK
jgi:hypothetical protein